MPLADEGNLLVLTGGTIPVGGVTPGDLAAVTDDVSALESALPQAMASTSFIPAFVAAGDVAAWFEDGLLGAKGLTDDLTDGVTGLVAQKVVTTGSLVPFAVQGENVLAWFQDGAFDVAKVSQGFIDKVGGQVRSTTVTPYTDGATLFRSRIRIAAIKEGVPASQLHVFGVGDSWFAQTDLSLGYVNEMVGGPQNLAGEGWLSLRNGGALMGSTVSASSGWTGVDALQTSTWPYGIGPDGYQLYTTGATATITYAGVRCTDFRLYFEKEGGRITITVDGANPVTFDTGTGGGQDSRLITGMTDAPHTIIISTTGNTGVVAVNGAFSRRTNVSGLIFSRFGHSGVTATVQARYREKMRQVFRDTQPDVVMTMLGTNDQFGGSTPAAYGAHLSAIAKMAKEEVAGCGVIYQVPARSNAASQTQGNVPPPFDLTLFRNEIRRIAPLDGAEYISMLDLFGDFATANAVGHWKDWGHPGPAGGRAEGKAGNDQFFRM